MLNTGHFRLSGTARVQADITFRETGTQMESSKIKGGP